MKTTFHDHWDAYYVIEIALRLLHSIFIFLFLLMSIYTCLIIHFFTFHYDHTCQRLTMNRGIMNWIQPISLSPQSQSVSPYFPEILQKYQLKALRKTVPLTPSFHSFIHAFSTLNCLALAIIDFTPSICVNAKHNLLHVLNHAINHFSWYDDDSIFPRNKYTY